MAIITNTNDTVDISASLQETLVEAENTLSILLKLDDTILDKLKLPTLKTLKHAITKVAFSDKDTPENAHGKEEFEHDASVSTGIHLNKVYMNTLQPIQHQTGFGDNMSTYSGITGVSAQSAATGVTHGTGITGVSSIAPIFKMDDPLVVIMGVGEYESNAYPSLAGVEKDYENIINTFVNYWQYKVFYQLSNNEYIYSNDKNELENNYKLRWNLDEIELFVEQARKCVVSNQHSGLLFAISSHGDTGKVMYDSNGDKYELNFLFSMFSPQANVLLESYHETKEQSQHLFSIPKLFFLDMCRGSSMAKVTQVLTQSVTSPTSDSTVLTVVQEKNQVKSSFQNKILKTTSNQEYNYTQTSQSHVSLHESTRTQNSELKSDEFETMSIKGMKKEEAETLVAQMANFSKLYANVEGFAVADGSLNGGMFLRNVCKVFKDTKFVRKNKWTQIIFKIREYTKRDATLFGVFNITQLVENEGTLERPIIFASKYLNLLPINENENGLYNDDIESNTLTITNVSKTDKIAVLIDSEQNRENRENLLELLSKDVSNNSNIFLQNGYCIIGINGESKEFGKIWDDVYISLFILGKK